MHLPFTLRTHPRLKLLAPSFALAGSALLGAAGYEAPGAAGTAGRTPAESAVASAPAIVPLAAFDPPTVHASLRANASALPVLEHNPGPEAPARGPQADDPPLLPFRIDEDRNRLLLEIPEARLGEDLLYMNTLATGLGSARTQIDRGQTGIEAIVRLERRGNRVHMVRENWSIRTGTGDPAEAVAAREAFPTSVIASFPIESESGGRLIVDASSFFFSDVFGVAERLRSGGQGSTRVDRDRSWISAEGSGSFPLNTEIRAVLTFVGDAPGAELRRTTPDATAATFEQHHSFMALPPLEGFRPRVADPRAGLFTTSYWDWSEGFDEDYRNAYANRWRLIPSNPEAYLRGELVEPIQPIIFYLDPGIPEPYRSNFLDGGMWWNEIFEAAGFRNAFVIRDLPEGANPMDVRYSMIYWVHRMGPGPSVGPSFRDPRTGEILKTVVRMDSWRSLVDYNIYAGLLPAAGPGGLEVDAESFVMARRRQHTAHEIGHTLGLQHNFIAASQGRSSVMDYPAPLISLTPDGRIDLSDAYREGGGAWDSLAVRYAYTWYPDPVSEAAGLRQIMEEGLAEGLRFITGGHAGQAGSIPEATQWIEGSSMLEALERTSALRRILVDRFDERAIAEGEPMSTLNMRFAHVYLHHRYALEGAIKTIGGMDFTYALRGDGQVPARVLPADEQRTALNLVLDHLRPSALRIPARVAALIPPAAPGSDGSELWIPSQAGPAFDPVALAGGLATEIVENLLHRERLARVGLFHARDLEQPSLHEVLGAVIEAAWSPAQATGPVGTRGPGAGGRTPSEASATSDAILQRTVQRVVLNTLLDLGGATQATAEVRAITDHVLRGLADRIRGEGGGELQDEAHRVALLRDLDRYWAGNDDPALRPRFPVVSLPWP
jgi:hypothetical protein